MVFSRFSHRLDKNCGGKEITAFYNSLRMQPVYMPRIQADSISNFIANGRLETPPELSSALRLLAGAKIVVSDATFDDLTIKKIREQIKGPSVKIAYFILTEECNFNCSYCYVKGEAPPGHINLTMSPEIAKSGVKAFTRLVDKDDNDRKMIILYGGEPLMNFRALKEIVILVDQYKLEKILPENTQILLITNGSLLTEEISGFLRNHKVQVAVSLDGDKEATDSCRVYSDGHGTYDSVMKGIMTAKRQGCDVSLSVTLSEKSLEEFDSTLQIIDSLVDKEFGFNMMTIDGPKEMELAEKTTDAIIRAYEYFIPKGVMEDRIMRKVSSFNRAEIYYFDCAAAGANQITISPEGKIGICHVEVGSRTDFVADVNDITFNPKDNTTFLEWSKRTPINMPQCQECIALGICGGGCPYNARHKHGSIWELDNRFCLHAKKILEYLIWDVFLRVQKKSIILNNYRS